MVKISLNSYILAQFQLRAFGLRDMILIFNFYVLVPHNRKINNLFILFIYLFFGLVWFSVFFSSTIHCNSLKWNGRVVAFFSKNSKFFRNFLKVLSFLELAARQSRYFVQKIKKTLFKPLSALITFLFELQLFLSFQYVITQCFRIWIHFLPALNSSYYFRYRDSCKTCVFWRSILVYLAVPFWERVPVLTFFGDNFTTYPWNR